MKPNLFNFATSELSQDAFFCWLLCFSSEKLKGASPLLYSKSKRFIKLLATKNPILNNLNVNSIKIKRQYHKIDFVAFINNELIIIFEDKVKSENHSNQLERYVNIIQSQHPDYQLVKIYIKNDFIWKEEKKSVEGKGFTIFDIKDICKTLPLDSSIQNDIYNDFSHYVQNKLNEYESFISTPVNNWKTEQWIGLNQELTDRVNYLNFGKHYVGIQNWFMIRWVHNFYNECHLSFEIYCGKLLIKGHVNNLSQDIIEFRNKAIEVLKKEYEAFDIKKSNRKGKISTLIVFNDFPITNEITGIINVDKTANRINQISNIFEQIKSS